MPSDHPKSHLFLLFLAWPQCRHFLGINSDLQEVFLVPFCICENERLSKGTSLPMRSPPLCFHPQSAPIWSKLQRKNLCMCVLQLAEEERAFLQSTGPVFTQKLWTNPCPFVSCCPQWVFQPILLPGEFSVLIGWGWGVWTNHRGKDTLIRWS